jgi:hypothetical protein
MRCGAPIIFVVIYDLSDSKWRCGCTVILDLTPFPSRNIDNSTQRTQRIKRLEDLG